MVSCTPYAFVSFYTAFIDEDAISPLGTTLPAFFLKSSMVWSTLFFVVTNRNIKSKIRGEQTGTTFTQGRTYLDYFIKI